MPSFDQIAELSFNFAAPASERFDATTEVIDQLKNGGFDATAANNIAEGVDMLLNDQKSLSKALTVEGWRSPIGTGEKLLKKPGRGSILYLNEWGIVSRTGEEGRWLEKPAVGGFRFLKDVVGGVDFLKAIILTSQKQMTSFCQPEREDSPLGYRFVRKDNRKLNSRDMRAVQRLEEWLWNCGDETDPGRRKRLRRDTFPGFIRKLVFDTLSYDACPIELEYSAGGKLSGMYNVPADTIRLCSEVGYEGDDEIQAIQVIDGNPYTAYTYDDLIYEVRNPRTDLSVGGYGFAEPEMFVRILTAWLDSFEYNRAGLSSRAVPRSILALFGEWQPRELKAFSNQMNAMMTGAGNAHRLPIIAAKPNGGSGSGVELIKIDDKFDDMFFSKWVTLLVSIGCAIYGVHPTEINMDSFDSKASSPLSGRDTAEKFSSSRSRGLIPRLGFVRDIINGWIVQKMEPAFRFEWVGLYEDDVVRKFEREKLCSTIDELRISTGKDPHPDPVIGNAPVNKDLLNLYVSRMGENQTLPES